MRLEAFKKYKNFSQGVIISDFWLEWNNTPVLEKVKWRFNFRVIILNLVIIDLSIIKNKPE